MPRNNGSKIEPWLRRQAEQGRDAESDPTGRTYWIEPGSGRPLPTPANPASRKSRQERCAEVFIEVANDQAMQWVRGHKGVTRFIQVVDGYCTARVRVDQIKRLTAHRGVTEIEKVDFLRPQLDHSVDSINGWKGLARSGRSGLNQGAGVVIGIVDYGLDFTLDDFRDPRDRRKTRIAYLWDQELTAKKAAGELPPGKYPYGVEYDCAEIERALRARNPFTVVRHDPLKANNEIQFHGTHVTGIAAGNGRTRDRGGFPAGRYVGVAPGATIVFVNLHRQAILQQVKSRSGTLANSIHLAHAIAYCFEKADELNMPCVVNLSMGFNGGGHDGNMVVEWIIDALLQKPGRAVVGVAGNEYRPRKNIYLRGSVREGERSQLVWEHGLIVPLPRGVTAQGDRSPNEMEIWYSSKSRLKARLIAPQRDEESAWVAPDERPRAHAFAGGEKVIITSDQKTPWQGEARIHVYLDPGTRENGIRAGKWTVELEVVPMKGHEERDGVRWDAWIERTIPDASTPQHERSRFTDYDPLTAITLTSPGTGRRVISVASCNSNEPPRDSDISEFSGRGPTRDGRCKPDIAAPGDSIISTNAGAGRKDPDGTKRPARVEAGGTSMAAPHVTGIVARLLGRQQYLTWSEIRDILRESATVPRGIATPDPRWGFGKADAAAAMRILEARLR